MRETGEGVFPGSGYRIEMYRLGLTIPASGLIIYFIKE
jgi:hypothetical protein